MSNKMKGLLKGLRYISQIFDEEKEQEMQIGLPTDVKHVAHIGWDGPAVESPSWMKDFSSSTGFQSAPLGPSVDSKDNPEIQWVSEDSKRGHRSAASSPGRDLPELPKASRRNSSTENDSPRKKDSSARSRNSRRSQLKDSPDGGPRSNQESSPAVPDIPRKSRRKKSKESDGGGGSTRSRSKGISSNGTSQDVGPDNDIQTPSVDDGEMKSRGNYKE